METISEHKAIVAALVAVIAAVINFTPVPEWLAWGAFVVFAAAVVYVIVLALHVGDRTRRYRRMQDPDADEKLKQDAAIHAHLMDIGTPGDR